MAGGAKFLTGKKKKGNKQYVEKKERERKGRKGRTGRTCIPFPICLTGSPVGAENISPRATIKRQGGRVSDHKTKKGTQNGDRARWGEEKSWELIYGAKKKKKRA